MVRGLWRNTTAVFCALALGAAMGCGESEKASPVPPGAGTGGDSGKGGQSGAGGSVPAGASGASTGGAGDGGASASGGSAGSLPTGGTSQAGSSSGGDSSDAGSGGSDAGDAGTGAGVAGTSTGVAGEDGSGGEQGETNREYALWPMPNPPSSGLPNPHAYVTTEDTVTDRVTGLVWERQLGEASYSFAAAQQYCETLNLEGFDDWRAPTLIELYSIVDWTEYPTIDDEAFPDLTTEGASSWSKTPSGSLAYVVDLAFGSVYANPLDAEHLVRCVRAGKTAPHRFQIEGATVREVATGLVWERVAHSENQSPFGAYCEDLVLDEYDDWRLPGAGELATLIEASRSKPSLDQTLFPDEIEPEELAFWADAGWLVDFYNVRVASTSAAPHHTRCVR